jgi:3-methyladenine DNA glycosylase AlkD
MDTWVAGFNNWEICDQVCGNLFDRTPFAWEKIEKWVKDEREFVRRAGFVMMAELAVHDKKATDAEFLHLFPLIRKYAGDDRNFVKKAVNWALRQIGKRNNTLLDPAIALSRELASRPEKSAKWIGKDALRELAARKM